MWWIPLRAARLATHLLRGMILTHGRQHRSAEHQAELVRNWHARVLNILNIEVELTGLMPDDPALLWVANHISWLDIPLLGSLAPNVVFVSKQEVRSWPVIGTLAAATGTLFMQRGSGSDAARSAISEGLVTGRHVVIFPEGTTSDGRGVKRFHARLFQAAIDCRVPLLPIAIRYLSSDNKPARAAAYIDDEPILGSIGRVLATKKLTARVHLLEPIRIDQPLTRNQSADLAQLRISRAIGAQTKNSDPVN